MKRCVLAAVAALMSTQIAVTAAGADTGGGSSGHPGASACKQDILAPHQRDIDPAGVYSSTAGATNPGGAIGNGNGQPATLSGDGATVTLDFGKDVGGITSIHFTGASGAAQSVSLSFSESSQFISSTNSDSSNGGSGPDGTLSASVPGEGTYTVPASKLRGGFRYLTISHSGPGSVSFDRVSLAFTAAPAMAHPDDYKGLFCSSDDLLNRIWYAGAYTVQLDTIGSKQGRVWGPPASGWSNSGAVGTGTSVLVDGAKRDRTIWPGDMGISVPTDLVSLGDAASIKNSLVTLYAHQDSEGALPYAGPEVNFAGYNSDTYNLWALIATADYVLYSNDTTWLSSVFTQYVEAVQYAMNHTDPRGLYLVSGGSDWYPSQSGESVEANALFYYVLSTAAQLAGLDGNPALQALYTARATALQAAINNELWDAADGGYGDTYTTSLTGSPTLAQTGNSLALWFGIPDTQAKTDAILKTLRSRWNSIGAVTPEWGGIGTFPGSMEVYGRFAAGDATGALDLIRREWGYMLNSPIGTGSSFWEGMTASGGLAYNAGYGGAPAGIYTSLAHGWATGPTGALTSFLLGAQPTAAGGGSYLVQPHPGNVRWAAGRVPLATGALTVSWSRAGGGMKLTVADAGAASRGVVAMPAPAGRAITIDGVRAWNGRRLTEAAALAGVSSARRAGGYVMFSVRGARARTFAWR